MYRGRNFKRKRFHLLPPNSILYQMLRVSIYFIEEDSFIFIFRLLGYVVMFLCIQEDEVDVEDQESSNHKFK